MATVAPPNWHEDIVSLPNNGVAIMDFVLALNTGAGKYSRSFAINRLAKACVAKGLLTAVDVAKSAPELISSKVISNCMKNLPKNGSVELFEFLKNAVIGDEYFRQPKPTKKRKNQEMEEVAPELSSSEKRKVARKVEKMNKKLNTRTGDKISEIPKTLPAGVAKTSFKGKIMMLPNEGQKLLEFIRALPLGVSKFERGHTYKRFLKAAIKQAIVHPSNLKQTKTGQLGVKARKAIEAAVAELHESSEGSVVFDRLKEAMIGEVTLGGTVKKLTSTMQEHVARIAALERKPPPPPAEEAHDEFASKIKGKRGRKGKNGDVSGVEGNVAAAPAVGKRVLDENVKTIQSERLRAAITDKQSFAKLPAPMQQQLLERYMASLL